MDKKKVAAAFNLWMQKFIDNPAEFEREFQVVTRHLQEQSQGYEPSYGENCAEYLEKLLGEVG
jgi:hypothetical protein